MIEVVVENSSGPSVVYCGTSKPNRIIQRYCIRSSPYISVPTDILRIDGVMKHKSLQPVSSELKDGCSVRITRGYAAGVPKYVNWPI